MRYIDFHTHLGDVCAPYDQVDAKQIYEPSRSADISFLEKLDYPLALTFLIKSKLFPLGAVLKSCRLSAQIARIEHLVQSMAKSGIEKCLVLPVAPAVSTAIAVKECLGRPGVHVLGSLDFSRLSPDCVGGALDELLKVYPHAGVKFHPNLQAVHPRSNTAFALYEAVAKRGLFVLMHVGATPFLRNEQGKYARFENVADLPSLFPRTKFVFCHMGAYFKSMSRGQIAKFRNCSNLWMDTSGVGSGLISRGLSELGHERVLFGSDWPYGTHRGSIAIVNKAISKYCRAVGLNETIVSDAVFYLNAATLLSTEAALS